MEISKAAVGIAAAACIAAGAGGAYLGFHTNAPSSAPRLEAPAAPEAGRPGQAVEQSEAVISEAPAAQPAPLPEPRQDRRLVPAERVTASRSNNRDPARDRRTAATPVEAPAPPPAPASESRTTTIVPVAPPQITDNQASLSVPPPGPVYEELVIAADSVIGLQLESTVTSEKARLEDEVVARVSRDVKVGDRVAIPAGAKAIGEVTLVERGGKVRERAKLGVRFTSIVLADGTRVPINTETIFREGDAPGGESAAKIGGGAIAGAILGGILGGAKGAAIGGSVGAGAGTTAVMAGGRNPATLSSGAPVTVRIESPVTVTVEK